MLLGSGALVSAWDAFAAVALAPRFGPVAVVPPALGLLALFACLQVAVWLPLPLPFLRSLLVVVCIGGLSAWGATALDDLVPPWVVGAGYAAVGAAAFLGAARGLARARRGEAVEWSLAVRSRPADAEAPPRRPFRSPMEAQVWIEGRRNGLALPAMSAFTALLYALPTLLANGRPPVALGALEVDPAWPSTSCRLASSPS